MVTGNTNGASLQPQHFPKRVDEIEPANGDISTSEDAANSSIPKLFVDDQSTRPPSLISPPRLPRPLPKIPAPKYSSKERRAGSKLRHVPLEPVPESDTRDLRDVQRQQQPTKPVHDVIAKLDEPKPKLEVARRKSEYFERSFGARDSPEPAAEGARNESMVLADVYTNVIIEDEFLFVTGLATFLAERYHRSTASTAVTLQHSACVFFAGSFDPTYIITVKAMPSLVQPTMNKRNIGLIQRYLERTIRVPLSRGFVRFVAMPEDSFGVGGRTLQALVEGVNADKWQPENEHVRHQRSIKALSLRRPSSRLAMRPKAVFLGGIRGEQEAGGNEAVRDGITLPQSSAGSDRKEDQDGGGENEPAGVPKRKKSFLHSFLKRSTPSLADLKATARVSGKEENGKEGQMNQ